MQPPSSDSPPPPPRPNTRRHERFEMYASVELSAGDDVMILPAGNISLGGVYLAADGHDLSALGAGVHLEVSVFDALDEKRAPVRLEAEIMRVDEEGLALMWITTEPDAAIRLAKLLDSLQPRKKGKKRGGE